MAFGAKTALVFILLAATAMAAHASSHYVSCKNEYCKPVTVNGVVIAANVTVNVLVDDVLKTLTCEVPDKAGVIVKVSVDCPLAVNAVAIVKVGSGITVKVLGASLLSLVGSILATLKIAVAVCL